MSTLEQLRQTRGQGSGNLQTVRKALQQVGDRERKRRKRQTEHTPIWTGRLGDVQLCLCALSLVRWNCAEAVTVLQHVRSPPSRGHLSTAEQITVLEDLFLTRDLELIDSWMHEHSPGSHLLTGFAGHPRRGSQFQEIPLSQDTRTVFTNAHNA